MGSTTLRRRVWRVGPLTQAVRMLLEDRFPEIWVEGEISNFRAHTSGHWYLTLKDAEAQIRAAMFRKQNLRLRFRPEDGMQVLCRGRISVYEQRGEYQLIIEEMEPRGSGALLLAFERLKARLEAEGLFAPERKRSLPLLPRRVGVVTSPTGAALRDILKVIRRRHPRMPVLLCPARVQGEGAGLEVAEALGRLGRSGLVDLIIVGRGGGSIEDLWAFNEEIVARAIVACPVPVVAAVGHETDFTIADFAADARAPTPSAAAEVGVPVRSELAERLSSLRGRAYRAWRREQEARRHRLASTRARIEDPRRLLAQRRLALDDALHRGRAVVQQELSRARRRLAEVGGVLREHHPAARLAREREQLAALRRRIEVVASRRQETARRAFAVLIGKLQALSPLAILGRGYAIVRRPTGEVVRNAAQVKRGERVEVLLGRGRLEVRIEGAEDEHPAPGGEAGGH